MASSSAINSQAVMLSQGVSDAAVEQDQHVLMGVDAQATAYVPNLPSVKTLAYGGGDRPNQWASSELYRLQRGWPYQRRGRYVPVVPQFKSQQIPIQTLASQPNANRSPSQVITPTADPATTVSNQGTNFIGRPGNVRLPIT